MDIQEQIWYNRGKYHAYSIVLDLLDSPDEYKNFKSKIKRLVDRHYEREKELERETNATHTEGKIVIRGYWRKVEPIFTRYTYICSVCETEIGYDKYGNLNFSNFCPNCGAEMSKGE